MERKKIVISGINMYEGGIISIYKDLLNSIIEDKIYEEFDIYVLVGKKELFAGYEQFFKIYEFPKSKTSWFWRIYYEYFYFNKMTKDKDIYFWLSMHDMTPRVYAKHRAVYCHNATVNFDMKLIEARYDKKVYLFSKFYKYLYAINIKKNDYVVVQQQWLKDLFEKLYKINNVIVSRPNIQLPNITIDSSDKYKEYTFVYISYPRFFKNFEIICEANRILEMQGITGYQIILSIDGSENIYAKELVEKYGDSKNIKFIGLQSREKVFEIYGKSDCMIFPSRLESWGLPITEYQMYNKPILVADEPYAHETVGRYDKVKFFAGTAPRELAGIMKEMILKKETTYDKTNKEYRYDCYSWSEFTNKLFVIEK